MQIIESDDRKIPQVDNLIVHKARKISFYLYNPSDKGVNLFNADKPDSQTQIFIFVQGIVLIRIDLEAEPHWMPSETACHHLTKAYLCNDMEQRSIPSSQKAEHEKVILNGMLLQISQTWFGLRFRKGRSGGLYRRDARTASDPGIA